MPYEQQVHPPTPAPPPAAPPAVPDHYPEGHRPQPAGRPTLIKRIGTVIAAAAIAIVKLGAKLKGLLLLLPKVKILSTSATMLVSVAAYSLIWGWQFALGFVLLLLVHEMGHVIQLRREGVPASAPLFIPFLGAVVGMKQAPKDAATEPSTGPASPTRASVAASFGACFMPTT